MIILNRLDGKEVVINALLIETIEQIPDTMITLNNGKKYIVTQTVEEVIKGFEDFISRTHTVKY